MLRDIQPGTTFNGFAYGSQPRYFFGFQNKVFFNAKTDTTNTQLWVTDGTKLGTYQFKNLVTTAGSAGSPIDFVEWNGAMWFQGLEGRKLWKSDGTPQGTAPFTLFPAGNSRIWNNALYFISSPSSLA